MKTLVPHGLLITCPRFALFVVVTLGCWLHATALPAHGFVAACAGVQWDECNREYSQWGFAAFSERADAGFGPTIGGAERRPSSDE
jgi:hypothetical protein